jgi:hypothetical protein
MHVNKTKKNVVNDWSTCSSDRKSKSLISILSADKRESFTVENPFTWDEKKVDTISLTSLIYTYTRVYVYVCVTSIL